MKPAVLCSVLLCAAAVSPGSIVAAGEAAAAPAAGTTALSSEANEFFESHIRPLLIERCQKCHGAEKQQGGLRLDGAAGLIKGGDSGPVVVAGDPAASPLVQAISYTDDPKMPPDGKLPAEAIARLTQWVKLGAPWPAQIAVATPPAVSANDTSVNDTSVNHVSINPAERSKHWAFQPIAQPRPPEVIATANPASAGASWSESPIDRFVLARLAQNGLSVSPAADRRTLIRRATLNLIGLPPRPEEVESFLADPSPDAFARVVDRLLASPHYGERWGRHWLDVARYSDTKGYVFLEERRFPYAYTYRDWVIRAFNEDLPYDRFLTEQLAADCLPDGDDKQRLAALGFITLGRRFLNVTPDIIDDRIDVVARGMLGLTVGCARCHDHKYDPIPTADYYSLYGVFNSTEERIVPIETPTAEFAAQLARREEAVETYVEQTRQGIIAQLRRGVADYLLAVYETRGDRNLAKFALVEQGHEINRATLNRWHSYLQQLRREFHPVFAPWFALAELPPEGFAAAAQQVIADSAFEQSDRGRINAKVAAALIASPPASLAEAARLYGALFAQVAEDWENELAGADETGETPPAACEDADDEALRQVLFGPTTPTSVPRSEVKGRSNTAQQNRVVALQNQVTQWRFSPGAPASAMALVDKPVADAPYVFVRGNPGNRGPKVPRQFLACLAGEGRQPFLQGSGRLELALAIANRSNPLTARVLVNRVWLHHFGVGLVRTPSDFGLRSDPPSHPELLDYLASRLMDSGWSIKWLQRQIMLSRVFQQSSDDRAECREKDPENRLLWKMNRQRLDWEALRDGLLTAAGTLDSTLGGRGVDLMSEPFSRRRTVYGLIDRQNLPGVQRAFDFASPDAHSPQRFTTTVPQQALYLFNSPFAVEQARQLAGRPDVSSLSAPDDRIRRLYLLLFGRQPSDEERSLGREFLNDVARSREGEAPPEPLHGEKISADPLDLTANRVAPPAGRELRPPGIALRDLEPPPVAKEPAGQLDPWQRYAQALLLTNEFLYVD